MANFKISASPGGALTAANAAYDDIVPLVDASVTNSDNANVIQTLAVHSETLSRMRPTRDAKKTPPLAADIGTTWSWVNQRSSVASQDSTSGAFVLQSPRSTGINYSLLVKTAPATPWTMTMEYDVFGPTVNNFCTGLVVRDSATGKFVIFGSNSDSGASTTGRILWSANYTNETTFSASGSYFANTPFIELTRFLRLADNGTNITAYASVDGVTWLNLGSASRTAFLASPNQIGFAMDPQNGPTAWAYGGMMIVRDFYTS